MNDKDILRPPCEAFFVAKTILMINPNFRWTDN